MTAAAACVAGMGKALILTSKEEHPEQRAKLLLDYLIGTKVHLDDASNRKKTQAPQTRQTSQKALRPLTSLSPIAPPPGQSSPNCCHPEQSEGSAVLSTGRPRVPCSGFIRIVLAISINSSSSSDTDVPR
jgi:hypothetical protein